jgi:hypothetical protein
LQSQRSGDPSNQRGIRAFIQPYFVLIDKVAIVWADHKNLDIIAAHMSKNRSDTQYLIKVNLKGNRRVWRSILLRGDQTLNDLHEMIYLAFDRYDEHLYSFYFPKAPARQNRFGLQPKEYASPISLDEPNLFDEQQRFNAARTTLNELKLKIDQTFEYLFDFGDMWWHELKVIGIEPIDPEAKLPIIVERRGESPQQYTAEDE